MVCARVLTNLLFLVLYWHYSTACIGDCFGFLRTRTRPEEKSLNEESLVPVVNFFDRYAPKTGERYNQYAMAIKAPKDKCADFINEKEFLERHSVINLSQEGKVYVNYDLIAARPFPQLDQKHKKVMHMNHSEYVLLRMEVCSGEPPMASLMKAHKSHEGTSDDGCVVFYTYNSPCIKFCTDPEKDTNIIDPLREYFTGFKGHKAFVFTDVYNRDNEADTKGTLAERLKSVDGIMPLYRCPRDKISKNIDRCFKCTDENGNIVDECLPVTNA